jgi:hypothetical protein
MRPPWTTFLGARGSEDIGPAGAFGSLDANERIALFATVEAFSETADGFCSASGIRAFANASSDARPVTIILDSRLERVWPFGYCTKADVSPANLIDLPD